MLFNSWLTGEKGWTRFDSVFRIECSQEERTLENFLEKELPEVKELWKKVNHLEKILKDLKICWIIDGYNEKSLESKQFLDSLDRQFNSEDHSIIFTTIYDDGSLASSDVIYAERIYGINLIKERDTKRIDHLGTLLNFCKWLPSLYKVADESLRDDSLIISMQRQNQFSKREWFSFISNGGYLSFYASQFQS